MTDRLNLAAFLSPGEKPPGAQWIGSDPGAPTLGKREARKILERRPRNRAWITEAVEKTARRHGLTVPADPVAGAACLLSFLCREVSWGEADAFPLEAMTTLENRYDWTFETDAGSLEEQLRREAPVVERAWRQIRDLASRGPLLVILNESTPRDYLTCRLPSWASVFTDPGDARERPVLLYGGLKISSSEHRAPLVGSPEGAALEKTVDLAETLGRRPVVIDFSRRRFPRAFLRICRFAGKVGWGAKPVGKVHQPGGGDLPGPKSPQGLPRIFGVPTITLMDPWPVSDPEIMAGLSLDLRKKFGGSPSNKPWQDDRIGARVEVEACSDGVYRPVFTPWIVPVLGGWVRADHLFKSRLARHIRITP